MSKFVQLVLTVKNFKTQEKEKKLQTRPRYYDNLKCSKKINCLENFNFF